MGRQAKVKLLFTQQQHSLLGTASNVFCSAYSTWHSILRAPARRKNAVMALQAALTGFILGRNTPAMPMTCSQVKHKSSGFFISSLQKKSAPHSSVQRPSYWRLA
ncbi:hypothetical protein AKN88_10090 [Thiopseudomonas alkaliphila]|uniref:Uncharacterized protein n=1 Tax=Thiopseudomonas alkaliphila TaxID=1697053 RepID=A0A0K1XGD8_9GAMM|nr:hypothetical protein AKN88_01680 [Thiopseudomonas alkaliphila]AKX60237.1 hypothetical protein AKN88_10090 [Thiopseudomonas alkaliphila]